jgi:hypothetical protein
MARRLRTSDEPWLRLLLYGAPGSTKTRTAATAAWDERTSPVLHFDVGGNTRSVEDFAQQPDRIMIEEPKELNAFYNWLKRGQSETDRLVKDFDLRPKYRTVIVDGITGFQRGIFGTVTGQPYVEPADVPTALEWSHYGKVLRIMTNFARLFYRLPLHVIITALERSVLVGTADAGGYHAYSPLLLGQSSTEVVGEAYGVARMMHIERLVASDRKDIQRVVSARAKAEGLQDVPDLVSVADFRTTLYQIGKDQHLINTPRMVNPTITKMLDKIETNRRLIEAGENVVRDESDLEETHR